MSKRPRSRSQNRRRTSRRRSTLGETKRIDSTIVTRRMTADDLERMNERSPSSQGKVFGGQLRP